MTNLLLKSLDAPCFHLIFTFGGFGRISLITSVISFLIPYADLCSFCRSLFSLLSQQQINPVERKIRFHMLPSELNQMSARIMAELLRYGELGPLNSLLWPPWMYNSWDQAWALPWELGFHPHQQNPHKSHGPAEQSLRVQQGKAWCANTLQEAAQHPWPAQLSRDPQPLHSCSAHSTEEQQCSLLNASTLCRACLLPLGLGAPSLIFVFKLAPICQPNT